MIRRSLAVLLLLMSFSCSKKNLVPSDVIPEAKMQAILWDLTRADQYSQDITLRDSSKKVAEINRELYQKVFSIHKITPQNFKYSFDFYEHHPDMLRLMLDSLQARKTRETEAAAMQLYKPESNVKPLPIKE